MWRGEVAHTVACTLQGDVRGTVLAGQKMFTRQFSPEEQHASKLQQARVHVHMYCHVRGAHVPLRYPPIDAYIHACIHAHMQALMHACAHAYINATHRPRARARCHTHAHVRAHRRTQSLSPSDTCILLLPFLHMHCIQHAQAQELFNEVSQMMLNKRTRND